MRRHAHRRPVTARLSTAVALATLILVWGSAPALAHGEDGESDPVNLVEQALAIVVNTPDAVGEAVERIEAALESETEEPTGELDVGALGEALAALEEDRVHDAEDALVAALGRDPHPEEPDPAASQPSDEPESPPAEDSAEPADESGEEPGEAEAVDDDHGLTSRVEGGFSNPGSDEVVALVVAVVLAVVGVVLWRI